MIRREIIVGAIGGVAIGYVLWLIAISIGDNATAGQWGPLVLVLSVVLANLRRGVGLVAAPAR